MGGGAGCRPGERLGSEHTPMPPKGLVREGLSPRGLCDMKVGSRAEGVVDRPPAASSPTCTWQAPVTLPVIPMSFLPPLHQESRCFRGQQVTCCGCRL